jgi:AcrR family transcriptional regulator
VSERAGISNGAIYHAFGSRGGLVGRAWVRAARRFLKLQKQAVDAEAEAVRAVVAAADTPAVFSEQYPLSARLWLSIPREELIGEAPAESGRTPRARNRSSRHADPAVDRHVGPQGRRIRCRDRGLRGRPATGLMLRRPMPPTADTRHRLAAAVQAILSVKLGDNYARTSRNHR